MCFALLGEGGADTSVWAKLGCRVLLRLSPGKLHESQPLDHI